LTKIIQKYIPKAAFLIVLISLSVDTFAQSDPVTRYNGSFKEVYFVAANDTSIKHGTFIRYYKGKVIERGKYVNNQPSGRWKYYNLNSILEYEYDFDKNEIIRISGKDSKELKQRTPCLFKGSPIVPYLFLANKLGYPQQAKEDDVQGKVVLALKINKKGEVYGFYIAEKLHSVIDHAVIEVAKTMPEDWEFIAATYMGNAIDSEYFIDIEFELEIK